MGRLMLVNEQDLIAAIALATFSQPRKPFLARQCTVCPKGASLAASLWGNCAPSPEHFAGPLSHVLYYWISPKSLFILINAVNVVARSDMI